MTSDQGTALAGLTSIKRMKSHAARATKLSPVASMAQTIVRRLHTLDQIRLAHEADGAMWLGIIRVDPHQISRQKSAKHLSVEELFTLGVSCSQLLCLKSAADLTRALFLMFEEFEAKCSGHKDVVPSSLCKPVDCREPLPGAPVNHKLSVAKFGKKLVFEYLFNCNIPCELDYTFTVVNLCDALTLLYTRLREVSLPEDAFCKIDEKIRDIVIVPIIHRLKHCSYEGIDQEIRKVKYRYRLSRTSTHRSTVVNAADGVEEEEPDFKKIFQI